MWQLQSIVIFLSLCALAAAPWVWRKAQQRDARRREMTGREALAYLLYADHCRGDRASLEHYERSAYIRGWWLVEADKRLAKWSEQA